MFPVLAAVVSVACVLQRDSGSDLILRGRTEVAALRIVVIKLVAQRLAICFICHLYTETTLKKCCNIYRS